MNPLVLASFVPSRIVIDSDQKIKNPSSKNYYNGEGGNDFGRNLIQKSMFNDSVDDQLLINKLTNNFNKNYRSIITEITTTTTTTASTEASISSKTKTTTKSSSSATANNIDNNSESESEYDYNNEITFDDDFNDGDVGEQNDHIDQCGNQINNNNNINHHHNNFNTNAIERQLQRNNSSSTSSSTTTASSGYCSQTSINIFGDDGQEEIIKENKFDYEQNLKNFNEDINNTNSNNNNNNQENYLFKSIKIMSSNSPIVYGALTRRLYNAWKPKDDDIVFDDHEDHQRHDNNDEVADDDQQQQQQQQRQISSSKPVNDGDNDDDNILFQTKTPEQDVETVETIYGKHQYQQQPKQQQQQQNDHRFRSLINEIQTKFHRIQLYPTESQVFEMLQFSKRCSQNHHKTTTVVAVNHNADRKEEQEQTETGLTFGEFCFFASVLINSANILPSKPLITNDIFMNRLEQIEMMKAATTQQQLSPAIVQLQQLFNENGFTNNSFPFIRHPFGANNTATNNNNNNNRITSHRSSLVVDYDNYVGTKFDIFLGGSCNPTRWRLDLVMPELKKHCITYYNPQVDDWGPELIELENCAKQNSEVLFFVIDNQTRAIASMIEVAFIAASKRKLILVINEFEQWSLGKTKICDDPISKEEYEALRKGRQYLRDIVERQEIPIFTDIHRALRSAILILQQNSRPQDLELSDDVTPVKNGHVSLGDKMIQMFHIYNQSISNSQQQQKQLTFAELPFAYRMLTGRIVQSSLLEQMARCYCFRKSFTKNPEDLKTLPNLDQILIDFNEFCIIVSELDMALVNIDLENDLVEEISENSETETETIRKCFSTASSSSSSSSSTSTSSSDLSDGDRNSNLEKSKRKKKLNKKSSKSLSSNNIVDNSVNGSGNGSNQTLNRLTEKLSNWFSGFFKFYPTTTTTTNDSSKNDHDDLVDTDNRTKQHRKKSNSIKVSKNTHQYLNGGDGLIIDNKNNDNKRHSSSQSSFLSNNNHHHHRNSLSITKPKSSYSHQHRLSPGVHPQHHNYNHRNSSASPLFRKSLSPRILLDQQQPTQSNNHHHHNRRRRSSSINHNYHYQQHQQPQKPPQQQQQKQSQMITSLSQSSITSLIYENKRDLYLGGCIDPIILTNNIQPLLKKHSITYSTPKFNEFANHERLIPLEAKNIEKCRHLLFVIPEDSLDITFMIIAAHYIGLGYRVILCIQFIDPIKSKLASKLSAMAIKDYNRGRSYLSDMATKSNVKVFDNIDEAIQCCIKSIEQSNI